MINPAITESEKTSEKDKKRFLICNSATEKITKE